MNNITQGFALPRARASRMSKCSSILAQNMYRGRPGVTDAAQRCRRRLRARERSRMVSGYILFTRRRRTALPYELESNQ